MQKDGYLSGTEGRLTGIKLNRLRNVGCGLTEMVSRRKLQPTGAVSASARPKSLNPYFIAAEKYQDHQRSSTISATYSLRSTMAPAVLKKRKVLDSLKTARPKKKFKKQAAYHSSSEDEDEGDFQPVDLADSDVEGESPLKEEKAAKSQKAAKPTQTPKSLGENASKSDEGSASGSSDEDEDEDEDEIEENDEFSDAEASSDEDDSDAGSQNNDGSRKKRQTSKRNDPTAFSTSISKILSTKLPSSVRADPVLSRSRTATQTAAELSNEKLEQRARAKLRAEKKEILDRGRVRDVLGVERGEAGETAEEERRLRKIAQRGVVKLFNAVRAAQVRGEEAARAERQKGTIGVGEREKAVNEVSKQGFLELINGKKGKGLNIEEA